MDASSHDMSWNIQPALEYGYQHGLYNTSSSSESPESAFLSEPETPPSSSFFDPNLGFTSNVYDVYTPLVYNNAQSPFAAEVVDAHYNSTNSLPLSPLDNTFKDLPDGLDPLQYSSMYHPTTLSCDIPPPDAVLLSQPYTTDPSVSPIERVLPTITLPDVSSDGSDIDAEGDIDDGGSEYIPSEASSPETSPFVPLIKLEPRGRVAKVSSSKKPTVLSARRGRPGTKKKTSSSRRIPTMRPRARCIQVDYDADGNMAKPIGDKTCPICNIEIGRYGDVERHISTHYQRARGEGEKWVCYGLPVDVAEERHFHYGLEHATLWPQTGLFMVGGCGRIFSRKDSLNRHMKRKRVEGECLGDVDGPWMPKRNKKRKCYRQAA
ncbi:hypothetical protein EW026_g882 [Hermanssonia centrifuga]|uniref:C2H2-type domain-containing protein n=1 Tax=Hermanssonia centrifuga TaxID=98765 RepID=A0A4S4KV30_9APHY|nr:hypothetical protein EW026_g882 [Hermanssonia centrifuga]